MEGDKTLDQVLKDAPLDVTFTCDRKSFSLRNKAIRISVNTYGSINYMYLGFGHVSPNVIYRGDVTFYQELTWIQCEGVGLGDMNSFLGDDGGIPPEERNGVYLTYGPPYRKDWYQIESEAAQEFLRKLPTALLQRDAANQELGKELLRRAAAKYDLRSWYKRFRQQQDRSTTTS